MEVTKLIEAVEELRKGYARPVSHVEIMRNSVLRELARINQVEMPPLLNESQRAIFLENIDHLSEFLESEDGADAVEVLVDAFARFTDRKADHDAPQAAALPVEPEHKEEGENPKKEE